MKKSYSTEMTSAAERIAHNLSDMAKIWRISDYNREDFISDNNYNYYGATVESKIVDYKAMAAQINQQKFFPPINNLQYRQQQYMHDAWKLDHAVVDMATDFKNISHLNDLPSRRAGKSEFFILLDFKNHFDQLCNLLKIGVSDNNPNDRLAKNLFFLKDHKLKDDSNLHLTEAHIKHYLPFDCDINDIKIGNIILDIRDQLRNGQHDFEQFQEAYQQLPDYLQNLAYEQRLSDAHQEIITQVNEIGETINPELFEFLSSLY